MRDIISETLGARMTARRASRPEPASNRAAKSDTNQRLPPYRALPVSELVAFTGNPRVHSPEQVARIAASITEFGFTNPILIDGHKGIIAGHGRLLAAQKLGLAVVPTIALRGLSDAQKRALIIADNKLALGSTWDNDLLAGMLGDLKLEGFDLSLTGFDALELDGLLGDGDGLGGSGNGAGSLAAQFGIPPFSVLNAREGWWQDRKRAWLALGIQSEIGRGDQAAISGSPMPLDRPGYAVPGGGAVARR
jgi:hypothetical protein